MILFLDRIVCSRFGHLALSDLTILKKVLSENPCWYQKDKLLRFENQAVAKHETLSFMEYLFAADNLL